MYGPRLKGRLATLRPPRPEDASTFIDWFSEPEMLQTLARVFPVGVEEEDRWISRMAEDPNQVVWAIEYEDRLVGTTGIHLIDWVNRHGKTGTTLGDRSVWGRGIASEAMQLRTRHAFLELNLNKLYSSYLAGNDASWRAQQKSGYREVGRHREHFFRHGRWVDEVLTEVLRADWLAAQGESR